MKSATALPCKMTKKCIGQR